MTVPARQNNYQLALDKAFEFVAARHACYLETLGAKQKEEHVFELPVLNAPVAIDLSRRTIERAAVDGPVNVELAWQILILHYLSANVPWPLWNQWISFADFLAARGYERVYRGRVINRLCGTVGRQAETFVDACTREGGTPVSWGDHGFYFKVFPALPLIIARFEGDSEFPPGASFIYPDNALALLPVEDLVVLSERVVARLQLCEKNHNEA